MQACTHTLFKNQKLKQMSRCFYHDITIKRKDGGSVLSEPRWAAEAFAVIHNKAMLNDVLLGGRDGMRQEDSTGLQMIREMVSFFYYEPMLLARRVISNLWN